jgi:hypothetical protein
VRSKRILVVYVDEAYDHVNQTYLIGAVLVRRSDVQAVVAATIAEREQPPGKPKRPFHWRRATTGRRKSFLLSIVVPHVQVGLGIVKRGVWPGQQEAARAVCLTRLVREVVPAGAAEIVLDRRDTDLKLNLDRRTLGRLVASRVLPRDVRYVFGYPLHHPILTVADAITGTARSTLISNEFLKLVQKQLRILRVP